MNLNEFKSSKNYREDLITESKSPNTDTVKNKEFYSLVSAFAAANPNCMFRDYLDTDGTFSIVQSKHHGTDLGKSVSLYLDACDYISDLTFTKAKKTGLISIEDNYTNYTGFWILFE